MTTKKQEPDKRLYLQVEAAIERHNELEVFVEVGDEYISRPLFEPLIRKKDEEKEQIGEENATPMRPAYKVQERQYKVVLQRHDDFKRVAESLAPFLLYGKAFPNLEAAYFGRKINKMDVRISYGNNQDLQNLVERF